MRVGRIAVAVAALALLTGVPAIPAAAADDYLVTSDPEPHDELDSPPGWVTLVFVSEADAELAKIVVQNSDGKDVTTGTPIVEGTQVTAQLISRLPKDTYTVTYRNSDAEHGRRGGTFQFAYGRGTWTEVDDTWVGEEEEPSVIASPPPPAPEPLDTPLETSPPQVSESPDPSSPEPSPVETESVEPSEEPESSEASSNTVWWLVAGGALLVAAGGAYVLDRRRRNRPPGS